jgi:hypothetical protein
MITILQEDKHMYMGYDFDSINTRDLSNKLFATFTPLNELDILLDNIIGGYSILYNKIFVLYVESTDEYVVTYNVELGNVDGIPKNTILVHRKKDFNVLYTVNGLNEVIKQSNNGVMNHSFRVDWQQYKNCILLTNQGELKQLKTKIHKIIEI